MYEEKYGRGEVPQYKRSRPHGTGHIVIFVILVSIIFLLIVGGFGFAMRALNPTPVRTTMETRTFNLAMGTQPTLIVTNDAGFVHVQPGAGNTMIVTTTKVGDGFGASPDDFKVNYTRNGNTITVHVNNDSIHPFDFSRISQADLNITVPTSSDLQLETNSGDITASGIHGKMTLTSNSGSLQATEVSLKSDSLLSTDSGSITISGSIGTAGRYMFQSNSGAIDVALPRSTSFHANIASNSGDITSDFAIAHQSGASSRTVTGDVGSSPQATVTINSDSGSIVLKQL